MQNTTISRNCSYNSFMHFFIMEVFCKKYMIFAFNVEKIHAELCKTLNIVDEVYDYFIRKKGLAKRERPFFLYFFFFFCNSHSMYAFAICYKCKLNIAFAVWGNLGYSNPFNLCIFLPVRNYHETYENDCFNSF